MHRYVAHANVDHYLALLNGDALSPSHRATALLVAELDRMTHDRAQLEFAETRAANARQKLDHVRRLRDAFAFDTTEREQAGTAIGQLRKSTDASGGVLPSPACEDQLA
ncbi:hypothetical protein [Bradyrhizobium sp. CCBAU 51745]|uniref:hypothetical protein n=1 Tax=Bradyrhizobium sp. CCBAU 51745 TaxID=1325099 RepID=UPI002306AA50|nr:hypothetical protein [Bradyrhizobium sp. CCBAU 51745]